jgi:DHA2 family multidrug resistance protein
MSAHISPSDPVFIERQAALAHALTPALGHGAAGQAASGVLYGQLLQQSSLGAYIDNFRLLAILCVICLPFLFLFKKTKGKKPPPGAH